MNQVLQPESSGVAYVFSPVTFASIAMTILGAFIGAPLLLSQLTPRYRIISQEEKRIINRQIPPVIHHCIISSTAFYAIASGAISDRVQCTSALGFTLLQTSLGYFIGDTVVLLLNKRNHNTVVLLAHHAICIIGVALMLYNKGTGLFFVVSGQITELSSIFYIFRNALKILNFNRNSKLCKICDTLFIVLFFLTRVLSIPWHWYELITAVLFDPRSSTVPLLVLVYSHVFFISFDSLNLYWFWKILSRRLWHNKQA